MKTVKLSQNDRILIKSILEAERESVLIEIGRKARKQDYIAKLDDILIKLDGKKQKLPKLYKRANL